MSIALKKAILEAIDQLRGRKARPDVERICAAVKRKYNKEPVETIADLEKLVEQESVIRVEYKGNISYRNASKWPRLANINRNRPASEFAMLTSERICKLVVRALFDMMMQNVQYRNIGVPYCEIQRCMVLDHELERFEDDAYLDAVLARNMNLDNIIMLENGNFTLDFRVLSTGLVESEVLESTEEIPANYFNMKNQKTVKSWMLEELKKQAKYVESVSDPMEDAVTGAIREKMIDVLTLCKSLKEAEIRRNKREKERKMNTPVINNSSTGIKKNNKSKSGVPVAAAAAATSSAASMRPGGAPQPPQQNIEGARHSEAQNKFLPTASRVGSRAKRARQVFDPSDNNLPRHRTQIKRGRPSAGGGSQLQGGGGGGGGSQVTSPGSQNKSSPVRGGKQVTPSKTRPQSKAEVVTKRKRIFEDESSGPEEMEEDDEEVEEQQQEERGSSKSSRPSRPSSTQQDSGEVETANKGTQATKSTSTMVKSIKKSTTSSSSSSTTKSTQKSSKQQQQPQVSSPPRSVHSPTPTPPRSLTPVSTPGPSETSGCCVVCNQDTSSKNYRLVNCQTCEVNRVHPICLKTSEDPTFQPPMKHALKWRCMDCHVCVICSVGQEQMNWLVVCQYCDEAFHASCHSPVLVRRPMTKWSCYRCAVERSVAQGHFMVSYGDKYAAAPAEPIMHVPTSGLNGFSLHAPVGISVTDEDLAELQHVVKWDCDKVADYFAGRGFEEEAVILKEQDVDGRTLLLMQRIDVLRSLKLKLGPALKIYTHVKRMQERHFGTKNVESFHPQNPLPAAS